MTSSTKSSHNLVDPRAWLGNVCALLDDRQVDARLDAALASFNLTAVEPVDHHTFHQAIGEFVAHIYLHALRIPHELTADQALAEGIHLVGCHYRSTDADGYDAARCDVDRFGPPALEQVLSVLIDAIKSLERRKHATAVLTQCLAPLSWKQRCTLAAHLLESDELALPADVRRAAPERFADMIPALIEHHLGVASELAQIVSPDLTDH